MIEEGTRQFDLYDLVSVLIPGSTFSVGLLPLMPNDIGIPPTAGLVILLLLGFVFGRGIHAIGIQLETLNTPTSHREYFQAELVNPTDFAPNLVDRFYDKGKTKFSLNELPTDRSNLNTATHKNGIKSLYNHARSYLHIDARGRSRTFQAVLDFCRGMMIGSGILCVIYITYAATLFYSADLADWAPYQTHLGSYGIDPGFIFFGAILLLAGSYTTFERIRSDYRTYYIEYLMVDFLVLVESD